MVMIPHFLQFPTERRGDALIFAQDRVVVIEASDHKPVLESTGFKIFEASNKGVEESVD